MTLEESIVVYLSLMNDERAAWEQEIINKAWVVISTEAERIIREHHDEKDRTSKA